MFLLFQKTDSTTLDLKDLKARLHLKANPDGSNKLLSEQV